MAVVHLISPPRLFYRYWRMSFIDFVSAMLGFWVTLFTSTEIGLATSVGFSIAYTLLRLAFPGWIGLSHSASDDVPQWSIPSNSPSRIQDGDIPPEAFLVRFKDDVLFPNAERIKASVLESVKTHYEPASLAAFDLKSPDRSWNVSGGRRIGQIRKRKGIIPITEDVTPLKYVVLDFGMANFIDTTGVLSLIELKMEMRRYIGRGLQFRFVNMSKGVRERFDRSEWEFALEGRERSEDADVVFKSIESALFHREGDDKSDRIDEKAMEV